MHQVLYQRALISSSGAQETSSGVRKTQLIVPLPQPRKTQRRQEGHKKNLQAE